MHIRFVILGNDEDSGRRQGLFQELSALEEAGKLLPHEQASWEENLAWFRKNLSVPDRFSRSTKPYAKNVALSWFKSSATEHISRMYTLASILESYGVFVEVIRSDRPGYVVYEDDHQVAAEPFNETET